MQEARYDTIEYEEDWQTVPTVSARSSKGYSAKSKNKKRKSQQQYEEEYEQDIDYDMYEEHECYYDEDDEAPQVYKALDTEKVKKAKKAISGQLLVKIQLIVCLVLALAAFGIKSFGGELYTFVNNWYSEQMNTSLVITTFNMENLE